jgi:putative heme-binding domain-containing protein
LKVIRYDQFLRAVFDKVPEPPPLGTPGADRITVHTDTNQDGIYDSTKTVIEGLNIATSVQVGRGGIWVLNPPYLLFYKDADGDDVPDGKPEVHLSGFGLQDTHSVANSLIWGPDGWLYGSNGSTTTGTVSSAVTKGVRFEGQCVWRYDPRSQVFEIYAEGGGNTFSLDIDAGGRVFSGTNEGGTRGYYYPQGSYSEKNWGKHGPLTNPYAFGFFHAMEFEGDSRRFPQAIVIYEGGAFPETFNGDIIAPNSLQNVVWQSRRIPQGSTYRTVDHPNLIESTDRWFRPVYCGVGPDGCLYLADWYDTRLSHVSPIDDWHKDSGRIYRVRPSDSQPQYRDGYLSRLSPSELVDRFQSPNRWIRQRAALEIGWRGDHSVTSLLIKKVDQDSTLEALWALAGLGEFSSEHATRWLQHANPDIRRWTVRLLGDRHENHPELVKLAATEADIQVRSQLAATAKRIQSDIGLGVLRLLVASDSDANDLHLPLMYWWCLEAHADDWDHIEQLVSDPAFWSYRISMEYLLSRLMQRYAGSGTAEDLNRCEKLAQLAPNAESRNRLLEGLEQAYQGRQVPTLPEGLAKAYSEFQQLRGENPVLVALREGQPDAAQTTLSALRDAKADLGLKIALVRALADYPQVACLDMLLQLAIGRATTDPALQRTAIATLARYDEDRVASQLIGAFYGSISGEHDLRSTACRTLASRLEWAKLLVREVTSWRLKPTEVPPDVIQQLRAFDDPELQSEMVRAFGKPLELLAPEKLAEISRLQTLLRASTGDIDKGKTHFTKHCGTCHKLFGEGEAIGPPLDAYPRNDLKFWLAAIVEPSLEIREGYQTFAALTHDGRILTGTIASQDPHTVTMRTAGKEVAENQTFIIARDDIVTLKALPTSLMPERLLETLDDMQLRDLFAYLRFQGSP